MTRDQLTLYGIELDAPPWSMEVARSLLDLVVDNPWGSFRQMLGGDDVRFEPFDRSEALDLFWRDRLWMAQTDVNQDLFASMKNRQGRNEVRLSVMNDVSGDTPSTVVEQLLDRMRALLPHPSRIEANADWNQVFFKRSRNLGLLPEILREVHWLQVVYPHAYSKYFDREALLGAPAYRVEEQADGGIWIWAYEKPFEFEEPATRQAIATLHRYLEHHLKVRDPADLCILAKTELGDHLDALAPGGPRAVIDRLVANPWAPLDRFNDEWFQQSAEPYSASRAEAAVRLARTHLRFTERADDPIEATFMDMSGVTAGLYVPEPKFGPDGRQRTRRLLADLLSQLPDDSFGTAAIDVLLDPVDARTWFDRHDILPFPPPLEGLPWLAVHRTSEMPALATAPGVSVEERDGRIWLQLYDDPFAYDTPDAIARIARISAHLHRATRSR